MRDEAGCSGSGAAAARPTLVGRALAEKSLMEPEGE